MITSHGTSIVLEKFPYVRQQLVTLPSHAKIPIRFTHRTANNRNAKNFAPLRMAFGLDIRNYLTD